MMILNITDALLGYLEKFQELLQQKIAVAGLTIDIPAISAAIFVFVIAIMIDLALSAYARYKMHLRRDRDDHRVHGAFLMRQLGRYLTFTIAGIIAIRKLGVPYQSLASALTAFSFAIGFGIQKIFQDLISGFAILVASSEVKVGDVIQVGDIRGVVISIGLRSTTVETRDSEILVVPNSYFTSNPFENFTKNQKPTRLSIQIGVAYGSNTKKVCDLLASIAYAHPLIIAPSKFEDEDWLAAQVNNKKSKIRAGDVHYSDEPEALFTDFGDSALLFDLVFFTREVFESKELLAGIRLEIDQAFRERNITIPFPQQDVWFRNPLPHQVAPKIVKNREKEEELATIAPMVRI